MRLQKSRRLRGATPLRADPFHQGWLPLVMRPPRPDPSSKTPARPSVARQRLLERDLIAWANEFLLAPDEPPPSLPLPLVFSLPPPRVPPRRAPSQLPAAA